MIDTYLTSDTAEATYLIISGISLLSIDYSQSRFQFAFSDTDRTQQLSSDYIAGRGLAEPNAYNRVNKKLLRIINKRCQWEED